MGELFASFDREPIAAASIAQVHAATLTSGARVVVKVRRPDVSQIVDRDLDIAGRLAARLERSTNWGRAVGAAGLAAGFAAALREELDLRVETRNMTSVAAAPGSRDIAIPVPYQPLCTGLVLVMERFDGRPLAAIDIGMPADLRAELARSLLDCLLREIMLEGTFHADPHPGNVLLLADGRLGLLDFGSVGRIDRGLRSALQRLLLALDEGDPAGLADALLEVVERPEELLPVLRDGKGLPEGALETSRCRPGKSAGRSSDETAASASSAAASSISNTTTSSRWPWAAPARSTTFSCSAGSATA